MASKLRFLNKTAIVTGAGGGIGKAYALELAKRGCNVVVNDLGGSLSGGGASGLNPAVAVVKEIVDGGGKAVYNNLSVLEGEKIIEQTLKEFNSVDILINNAGILRDKSFHKMTHEDWKLVLDVHLQGTFALCHAVWPIMQKQNYGRIVNVSSASGLYGNFGQANYSAAKMGIFGLTNTLAKEGEKTNIKVNCIVPVAASRMTETVLPPALVQMMQPEHIVPIVTYLAHESTTSSGDCFEVGGGWFSKVRFQRSAGRFLGSHSHPATAEQIQDNIESISDFTRLPPSYPTSAADSLKDMMAAQENARNASTSSTTTASTKSANVKDAAEHVIDKIPEDQTPLESDKLFKAIQKLTVHDKEKTAELASKVRAKVAFQITNADGTCTKYWLLDFKTPDHYCAKQLPGRVEIADNKPAVTLKCSDKTFTQLSNGSLSPEFAYIRGLLKIDGHMGVALKVKVLLDFAGDLIKKGSK